MLEKLRETFSPPEKLQGVLEELRGRYKDNNDPWGFNLEACELAVKLFWPLYQNYFRVKVHGIENVKDQPYMVVSNHSGQIAIDGVLITMAFALDVLPPRILRGMVERFLSGMPFLGDFVAQTGSILGDRKNCQYLLDKGESILVFPEGVRGVSKSTPDFYKLQSFTKGFYRIALQTRTPILPICVIGAEEFYPYVLQMKKLAQILKMPAIPLTPTFPLLGPLGILPMPSPVDIYIGKPIPIPENLSPEANEKELNEHVYQIESQIKAMIKEGLKNRRTMVPTVSKDKLEQVKELVKMYVKK
ncbi:MAG: lysophospholipid acyltransferase family protein [Bacteriovoracaceae bacterium]